MRQKRPSANRVANAKTEDERRLAVLLQDTMAKAAAAFVSKKTADEACEDD